MTNIGSLLVKRGNGSWAILFGKAVCEHPRVCPLNKAWGFLVLGEAQLSRDSYAAAEQSFAAALDVFQTTLSRAKERLTAPQKQERAIKQAEGNIRWTQIHLAKSRLLQGQKAAANWLKQMEKDWSKIDPEASTMAGLFYVESLEKNKRQKILLRELHSRAQRHSLGEIIQRISQLLAAALVFISISSPLQDSVVTPKNGQSLVKRPLLEIAHRGNTGN